MQPYSVQFNCSGLRLKPHPSLPVPTIVGDAVVNDEVDVLEEVFSREVAKLATVLEGRAIHLIINIHIAILYI